MRFVIIPLISFLYWQWISLYLFAISIKGKNDTIQKIQDKTLLDLVYKKTGLLLESIRISSAKRLYGMMIGLPGKPYMILSKGLYESFDHNEKEYVVLHEAGHYLLGHSKKLAVSYFTLLIISFLFTISVQSLFIWVCVAVLIGILQIQVSRMCEYEADAFTLEHITNPQGMINATQKFEKQFLFPGRFIRLDEDTLIGRLIYISIPYNIRKRRAYEEIQRRKK